MLTTMNLPLHTSVWVKSRRSWCCYASLSQPDRKEIRLGLPSKGRMSADTLQLLQNCQLSVKQVNPRQYVAEIPQLSNLDVWFQRPKDIVRKLLSGDLDLGIVGLDTFSEHGQGNDDLIIVHEALEYGDCRLSLAIPQYGIFENVNSLDELAKMPQWTEEKPLRVATGFTYLGPKFMKENGLKHVTFSTADGALEAAPAMGIADAILDLVSSGTTLRENNLKEIKGGVVLESQAVFITSRKSVIQRKGVLETTHEMLERLEAHLRAIGQFTVTANMRGSSAEEVAERILSQPSLMGLQGPTVSPVFCKRDGKVTADYYAIVICVPQKALYKSIQQLRATPFCTEIHSSPKLRKETLHIHGNCGLQDKIKLVPIDLQNRPAWYKEKVYPENKVPSLEHNGKVLGESLDLVKYIDDNFEGPSLVPSDPAKKEFGEELISHVDTFTKELYSALKGDPIHQAGPAFDYLENALGKFGDGPFFLGQFSWVDIAYVPFVERFQLVFADVFKHDITEGRPKLATWIEEVNKISAYTQTRADPKEIVDLFKKRFLAQQ
ncbi:hypothetical protein JHK84_053811 [Glycine max]|nr:hypothetical protein JHK84_053811 [Glycine max]